MNRHRRHLLTWLAVLPLGTARAQTPAWGIDALMSELARQSASEVRFRETKHLAALKTPLELTGVLRYRRPAYLEKHIQTPSDERFIVDGDRLTMERQGGQRHTMSLQSQPVLWAFIESIRATLRGDAATLQRFYKLQLHGGRDNWSLILLPSEVEMGELVNYIRITGTQARVRSVEIQEAGGDRSVMRILEDGA